MDFRFRNRSDRSAAAIWFVAGMVAASAISISARWMLPARFDVVINCNHDKAVAVHASDSGPTESYNFSASIPEFHIENGISANVMLDFDAP